MVKGFGNCNCAVRCSHSRRIHRGPWPKRSCGGSWNTAPQGQEGQPAMPARIPTDFERHFQAAANGFMVLLQGELVLYDDEQRLVLLRYSPALLHDTPGRQFVAVWTDGLAEGDVANGIYRGCFD